MRITIAPRLAAVALASAALVPAAAATVASPAAAAATCQLGVEQPIYNGSINAWGHWANCPSTASITVVLREDRRWWPDRTLESRTGTGSSGSRLLVHPCGNNFDPIKVFVEVRYGSQKVQSPRSILPCA